MTHTIARLNNVDAYDLNILYRLLFVHFDVLDLVYNIHTFVTSCKNRVFLVPVFRQHVFRLAVTL